MGIVLTSQVEARESKLFSGSKKAVTLTVAKPAISYMAKAYADQVDAADIKRLQKVAGQIDRLSVSFLDTDASDYILQFSEAAEPVSQKLFKVKKKSVDLTLDTPIIEYLARIYADQVEADDIVRLQRMCRQIDHITVSFRDEEAADYVLRFPCLDEEGLENWMFNEGYLLSATEPEPEADSIPLEAWMLDAHYLE